MKSVGEVVFRGVAMVNDGSWSTVCVFLIFRHKKKIKMKNAREAEKERERDI